MMPHWATYPHYHCSCISHSSRAEMGNLRRMGNQAESFAKQQPHVTPHLPTMPQTLRLQNTCLFSQLVILVTQLAQHFHSTSQSKSRCAAVSSLPTPSTRPTVQAKPTWPVPMLWSLARKLLQGMTRCSIGLTQDINTRQRCRQQAVHTLRWTNASLQSVAQCIQHTSAGWVPQSPIGQQLVKSNSAASPAAMSKT